MLWNETRFQVASIHVKTMFIGQNFCTKFPLIQRQDVYGLFATTKADHERSWINTILLAFSEFPLQRQIWEILLILLQWHQHFWHQFREEAFEQPRTYEYGTMALNQSMCS
jgi:hypothetical protein